MNSVAGSEVAMRGHASPELAPASNEAPNAGDFRAVPVPRRIVRSRYRHGVAAVSTRFAPWAFAATGIMGLIFIVALAMHEYAN